MWYWTFDILHTIYGKWEILYETGSMMTMMTMVMMNDEWWTMNHELWWWYSVASLCLPSTPFELSWPKCRVNRGRGWWAAPDQSEPQDHCSKFTRKSSKNPEIKMHPPKGVFLWFLWSFSRWSFLSRGIDEGVVISSHIFVHLGSNTNKQRKVKFLHEITQNGTGLTKTKLKTLPSINDCQILQNDLGVY